MDLAATVTTMLQANTQGSIGAAAMKMALKSDQTAAALLNQAVESAAPAPAPAGMGNLVDMTV